MVENVRFKIVVPHSFSHQSCCVYSVVILLADFLMPCHPLMIQSLQHHSKPYIPLPTTHMPALIHQVIRTIKHISDMSNTTSQVSKRKFTSVFTLQTFTIHPHDYTPSLYIFHTLVNISYNLLVLKLLLRC